MQQSNINNKYEHIEMYFERKKTLKSLVPPRFEPRFFHSPLWIIHLPTVRACERGFRSCMDTTHVLRNNATKCHFHRIFTGYTL